LAGGALLASFGDRLLARSFWFERNVSTVEGLSQRKVDALPASEQAMRLKTRKLAEQMATQVRVAEILNSRSLRWPVALACCFALSLIVTQIARPAFSQTAFNRIAMLGATPWPRFCQIQLAAVKVARQNPVEGIPDLDAPVQQRNNQFKIARGSSVTILVEAESTTEATPSRQLPDACWIYMTGLSGVRSSARMTRVGTPRNGKQLYSFSDQMMSSVLDDIAFEIRGGDARTKRFTLQVVVPPSIEDTRLACVFPEYMTDVKSGRWMPREKPWAGTSELPIGTTVTIRSKTNKPIRWVYLYDVSNKRMEVVAANGNQFDAPLPPLNEPLQREIYLRDSDGIVSEQPFKLSISPTEDQPPFVQTRLNGIGTAVTPNVRIPVEGIITDDYGIKQASLEFTVGQGEVVSDSIDFNQTGAVDHVLDFLDKLRTTADSEARRAYELPVTEGSTLSLIVKASDHHNLGAAPQIGFGDKYVLDVVESNELVRILERLEVGQRQRLEQIYVEVGDARNNLARTGSNSNRDRALLEPGDLEDDSAQSADSNSDALSKIDIRLLFAQRARLQAEKTKQELLGVTDAFENIRQQLINNRIDSEDRQERIQDKIAIPLRVVATESVVDLIKVITELESQLRNIQDTSRLETSGRLRIAATQTNLAIAQADSILAELKTILDSLVKYETQNELLEIVRQMIREQKEILMRTKQERQQKAFEGLLD
jgi:hypothetical protein